MNRPALLDDEVVAAFVRDHAQWRVDDGHLVRELVTTDYPTAVLVVDEQVALCERLDHHPVVTIGYRTLRFELWTHDRDGLTELDLDYAAQLDEMIATRFGDVVT